MKARRIRRPSSVRIGMFCRLGSNEARRPVLVDASANEVCTRCVRGCTKPGSASRSEEHTSELQSRDHLVCRLLLEKKKKQRERECVIKKIREERHGRWGREKE